MVNEPLHVTDAAFEKNCSGIIPSCNSGFLGALVRSL